MLININDIRKHRPIAKNLDSEQRIESYINEVEILNIIPAISGELYKQLEETPENHQLLLDGGFYENNTKHIAGLKAAIALLAYARFLPNNNINVTAFGVNQKLAQHSGEVDRKEIFRQANEAQNTGSAYLNQCLEYINQTDCGVKTKPKGSKFKAIGQ